MLSFVRRITQVTRRTDKFARLTNRIIRLRQTEKLELQILAPVKMMMMMIKRLMLSRIRDLKEISWILCLAPDERARPLGIVLLSVSVAASQPGGRI